MASVELRALSGRKPEQVFLDLKTSLMPNESDMALAGQLVRSQIRKDTAAGIDVDGAPFAPYATNHPYYYNPGTRGGKMQETEKATARFHKKLEKKGVANKGVSRTGRTVKFENYAAFKSAFGRDGVDLQGIQAPHMLDAIVVAVNGRQVNDQPVSFAVGDLQVSSESSEPASAVTIAIYDERAAAVGSGHQYGNKTLPRRKFFGASQGARERVVKLLKKRLMARARKSLEKK
jgi:hypothetical protein